jgi:hypothetical protein
MQKKLTLVHPDEATNGAREFVEGREGVDRIVRADGGYAVLRGSKRLVYPDHRVSVFEELRHNGVAHEPEETKLGKLDETTGEWQCALCPPTAKQFKSFHALKTHHGRSHG